MACASPPKMSINSVYAPPFVANLNINDLENIQEYEINIKEAKMHSVFLAFFPIDVNQYDVPSYWINVYKYISDEQWEYIKREFKPNKPPDIMANIHVIRKSDAVVVFNSVISNPNRITISPWGEKVTMVDIQFEPGNYLLHVKLTKVDQRLKSMFNKIGLMRTYNGK